MKYGTLYFCPPNTYSITALQDKFPTHQKTQSCAILFIHGYANTLETSIRTGGVLGGNFRGTCDVIYFSWPSKGKVIFFITIVDTYSFLVTLKI